MPAPLIGITTSRKPIGQDGAQVYLNDAYSRAVLQAGGLPVLIPVGLPKERITELLARLDGVLLSGGGDIDPALFGGEAHPKVYEVDAARDELEITLARGLIQGGKPVLAICRGAQVINVALGGSLYTHIADQFPGALNHERAPDAPRTRISHEVEVKAGTHLAAILQVGRVGVNSLHHQGIRDLAAGLTVSATAEDGLIEGVELPGHPFAVAVQWHPEWLQDDPIQRALFQAFVESCSNGRTS
jgi:putative glutamine amidotransferase